MATKTLDTTKSTNTSKKKMNWRYKDYIVSYIFLLPAMLFFLTFVIVPILRGFYVSFFDYSLKSFKFIGLKNYTDLFTNPDLKFLKAMGNTALIVLGNVPLVIIFSLFVSVNIYQRSSTVRSFFRGVFYLPAVSSIVSVTVVWGWIYHQTYGVLNYLLGLQGENAIAWLGNEKYALVSIIAVLFTTSVGQPIILYIASLGNIPSTYKEAAEIDGANGWQTFKNVVWPLLMPTTLYIAIITTINSFQIFSLIQLLTSGGPVYSTTTIMYQVYERAFQIGQFGISSAMGMVLAVIIVFISFIQFKVLGSDVEY